MRIKVFAIIVNKISVLLDFGHSAINLFANKAFHDIVRVRVLLLVILTWKTFKYRILTHVIYE